MSVDLRIKRCANCDCFSVKVMQGGENASGKCFLNYPPKVEYVQADYWCESWKENVDEKGD